jgi:predicted phage terminase large subunit-like protein
MNKAELRKKIEKLREQIHQEATPFPDDSEKAKEERKRDSLADPLYFFKSYLPHYFPLEFAPFHAELAADSELPDEPVFRAAPREHAKSTIVSFGMPVRDICLELRHFIIMLSDTEDLAEGFLMFIKLELEENARIKQDFSDMRGFPWTDKDFTTRNGVRMKARGAMGRIRGLRNRQYRPDKVILDDFENDKTVKNVKLTRERFNWVREAVIPALADNYYFTYVGTILAKKSVLNYFLTSDDPKYNGRIYDAEAGENNQPLWPARWTPGKLLKRKWAIGLISYNKEYRNRVTDDERMFQEEWIKYYHAEDLARKPLKVYMWIDPSSESGATNDYKAVITLGSDPEAFLYVLHAFIRRCSPDALARAVYDIYEEFHPLVIGAEENALGEFLYVPFDLVARERGYHLPMRGFKHSTAKETRVGRLSPLIQRAIIKFRKNHSDQKLLIDQLLDFPEGDHDDGPDALEGADSLIAGPSKGIKYERLEQYGVRFGNGAW